MYNVAFAYTASVQGYEGVVTWSSFESEGAFDAWYTEEIKRRQRVVEKGISPDRCVELVRQTPRACRVAAALEESRIPGTEEVDPEVLSFHLTNVALAEIFR